MPLALNNNWNASSCPTPMLLSTANANEQTPTSKMEFTGV